MLQKHLNFLKWTSLFSLKILRIFYKILKFDSGFRLFYLLNHTTDQTARFLVIKTNTGYTFDPPPFFLGLRPSERPSSILFRTSIPKKVRWNTFNTEMGPCRDEVSSSHPSHCIRVHEKDSKSGTVTLSVRAHKNV